MMQEVRRGAVCEACSSAGGHPASLSPMIYSQIRSVDQCHPWCSEAGCSCGCPAWKVLSSLSLCRASLVVASTFFLLHLEKGVRSVLSAESQAGVIFARTWCLQEQKRDTCDGLRVLGVGEVFLRGPGLALRAALWGAEVGPAERSSARTFPPGRTQAAGVARLSRPPALCQVSCRGRLGEPCSGKAVPAPRSLPAVLQRRGGGARSSKAVVQLGRTPARSS